MKLKDMSKEELEELSYTELAEKILIENNKQMKIVDIFKKICDLLELSNSIFENQVADFFQLISTDKNFIVLDKGFCDLRKKHSYKVVIEEDEEDSMDVEEEPIESDIEETTEDEDIFYDNSSDDNDEVDTDDDDLEDFMVVDDESEEETSL